MSIVYGVVDPNKNDEVICVKCENIQWEGKPQTTGDKIAWKCRLCGSVNEGNKLHLLVRCNVQFDRRRGPI